MGFRAGELDCGRLAEFFDLSFDDFDSRFSFFDFPPWAMAEFDGATMISAKPTTTIFTREVFILGG